MFMRISIHIAAVSSVAMFLAAGCAKQDVVKKDEGLVPVQATKPAAQPESTLTAARQEPAPAAGQSTAIQPSSSDQQSQKSNQAAQLQPTLDNIYFDFDSADLSESARKILAKNAEALMKGAPSKIRIEGNCDERGSAEYNLALGERRAKSALQYLITLGVKADRLSTISYGKEKPAAQGGDEAAWAKNRRDEFVAVP